MIKKLILFTTCGLLFVRFSLSGFCEENPSNAKTRPDIVEAANKFLATLDDAHRSKVVYDFTDDAQRRRWSNLPMFKRGGLRMGDLTKPQRDAVLALLATALSPGGYKKVVEIMDADELLKTNDSGGRRGPRGGNDLFGRDQYYVSFVGDPSASKPWMIQFGGHHLGLNITLAGDHGTLAPSHTGAQPAIYELEGKTVRPLGNEVDKAFTLMDSLDQGQRKQAIIGSQMRDLVLGPGRDGQTIQPEGIKGSALSAKQRDMLVDLAGEWAGIQNETTAREKLEEIKRDISETWFAWSGPTEKGGAAYFRVQGPTVFIEYAPQSLGGDPNKHIHTIYRDPTNDYGRKWWKH